MNYKNLYKDNEDLNENLHEVLFKDILINKDLYKYEEILERSSLNNKEPLFLNKYSNLEFKSFIIN